MREFGIATETTVEKTCIIFPSKFLRDKYIESLNESSTYTLEEHPADSRLEINAVHLGAFQKLYPNYEYALIYGHKGNNDMATGFLVWYVNVTQVVAKSNFLLKALKNYNE